MMRAAKVVMMREGMEMSAEFGGKIMEQAIGSACV
jgi:hypothetical protein